MRIKTFLGVECCNNGLLGCETVYCNKYRRFGQIFYHRLQVEDHFKIRIYDLIKHCCYVYTIMCVCVCVCVCVRVPDVYHILVLRPYFKAK